MSASAESILEQYPSTLNRRPHRQRTHNKHTSARLYRQLFSPPNPSPPYHRIYINAVVAESPPLPHGLPTDRTQPKTLRTRRTRPLTLTSFPPHFRLHPSSPILSPPPETSHREQGRLSAGMKASILPQPPSLEITNSTYNLIWRVVSARI